MIDTAPANDLPPQPRPAPRTPRALPPTRDLPHNLELERAVLANVLDGRSPTAIHRVRELLPHALVFFHRDHRIVYLACLELDDAGQRVDAGAVAELLSRWPFADLIDRLRQQEELLDRDELDRLDRQRLRELYRRMADAAAFEDSALAALGGFNAVLDLSAANPFGDVKRNAELVLDYHRKRKLILRLTRLCDRATRTPDAAEKLLEEAGTAVLELSRGAGSTQVYSAAESVDATIDAIVERNANPEQGVKTGIADLDRPLMALRSGGLYILAARPGVGKTSLALKIAANIVGHPEHPKRTLFVSLEVDRTDLIKKLLAAESGVEFRRFETGEIDTEHWSLIKDQADRLRTWPLDLLDISDLTVQGLRAVVKRRMLETPDLGLVVLDYLQLLSGSRPDHSEQEKISEITRVLKVLARDLKIPVMALSQMNRESEKGGGMGAPAGREPRLSDLRGSGTIEQDADAVIFIHRIDSSGDLGGDREAPRKVKLILAKNRFGETGGAKMLFFPTKLRFEQAAFSDDEEDDGPRADPIAAAEKRQALTTRRERRADAPSADEDLFR